MPKKRLYILEEETMAGRFEIFKSHSARSVLRRAKRLFREQPQREFEHARSLPLHRGRSDDELREWLKSESPNFSYQIAILKNICSRNNCGDYVATIKVASGLSLKALNEAG